MARITTRDCERAVPNRFELVLLAAQRAHDLWNGAEPQLGLDRDKPTVLALREIAARRIEPDLLRQRLIERYAAAGTDVIAFDKPPARMTDGSIPGAPDVAEPPDGTDLHGRVTPGAACFPMSRKSGSSAHQRR